MKYTFVKQHDTTDCAAACLAMICLHYGKETSISLLRNKMGTDLKGTNLMGLSNCAKELGFLTQAVRVTKEDFKSDFTLPCIANVVTKEGFSHFVVIFKKSNNHIVLGDPAKDLMKISLNLFFEQFTGVLLLLKPEHPFIKEKTHNKNYTRYLQLMSPHKKLFACAIIASFVITLLGIISSLFNKILMDEILPYRLENLLIASIIAFSIITVISQVISFVKENILLHLSQKIDIPMMLGYFNHVFRLPMKFFSSRRIGDIITRFSDASTIKNIFTSIALSLVLDIIMALVSGVVLFKMASNLFAIIVMFQVINVLIVLIYKPVYKSLNEKQMLQSSILNSEIIEGLRGIESIKSNANEEKQLDHIEREYIRSLRIAFREGKILAGHRLLLGLIGVIGNMILTYVGILHVLNGELTLGTYMAFSTLAGYFTQPIGEMIGMQLQIQEAQISMRRLSEILDEEQEQEDIYLTLKDLGGNIEFKNISFKYGNRKPVLNNISFSIPYGKKVALVGASGSGKSTIAKLLLKYYEPENGQILFGGKDIQEYDNNSIRNYIGYVPQNIELFSKSVFENISMSKKNVTIDEVKDAAKLARAHEFIQALPNQYNTFLEEAGNGLSSGEKQRLVLARAFLKQTDFYIIDEGTSFLDFVTENTIFNMIYNDLSEKTMLIIAHRLSSICKCDHIIVLSEGEIIEQGTHDDLLKKDGEYSRLWELQQGIFTNKGKVSSEIILNEECNGIEEIIY